MNKIQFMLIPLGMIAVSGCSQVPTTEQNISAASSLNSMQVVSAQQARSVCAQFGATPGTRMFYNCMKEQTEAAEFNIALANCRSDSYSRKAKKECISGGSGFFGLHACLQSKEKECERNAKLSYLPDANSLKIENSEHQYVHTYSHSYGEANGR